MTKNKKNIVKYKRIPYNSFVWKFGNTSFRTNGFNRKTERQLRLLNEFWKNPENKSFGWESKNVQNRYYDWLARNEFITGDEKNKDKAAREKTSGLCKMGLISENRCLTEVGLLLLKTTEDEDLLLQKNKLNISGDSLIYLEQLLKFSSNVSGYTIRPLIVILYLLSKLKYLTYDEFTYLVPLCTSYDNTELMLSNIKQLRSKKKKIDDVIIAFLKERENYNDGLTQFVENVFSRDLLLSVCMDRKSPKYINKYVSLYREMYAVYMEADNNRICYLFSVVNRVPALQKWKELLFNTGRFSEVKKDPGGCLNSLPESAIETENSFKKFFFWTMHLFKAKSTLKDYFDLNKRFLSLTNCFLFEDCRVKLDIVPKHLFDYAITDLYKQAYQESPLLFKKSSLEDICPALLFDEKKIIKGINRELGTDIKNIGAAYDKVDRLRYERFKRLVDEKFTDEKLIQILDYFDNRSDDKIKEMVTDNAESPAIFEYILGVIWYKISGGKCDIRDFMKRLDADLLPVSHAAGGDADIIYGYSNCANYPEHKLLLEATLADSTNQRRMEMEPVSRHLGNHLLKTGNKDSYCVFVATYLDVNVIGDFRLRKSVVYCDSQDPNKFIRGMKIIPLNTADLRGIINKKIPYTSLFKHFHHAYDCDETHPQKWYDGYVNIKRNCLKNIEKCS